MSARPDVTALMLTIGEPTFERARESVLRQTHPVRDIVVVENVHPFHRAFNAGAQRVRTPFFVQVDSDMILDEDCVENLLARFADGVGSVVCHLRDALYGRVEGVKMYRTACVGGGQPDSISPDTDFHDRLWREGWATVYALRQHDRPRDAWHTFGEHRPDYTPFFGYARHVVDGRRWRYRGNAQALRHRFQLLHRSSHPAALISHVALAHGVFLPGESDLLDRYQPDADYRRIVELLARDTPRGRPLRSRPRIPALSPRGAFLAWYRRGIAIARDGYRRDLEDDLARLHGSLHPWAWLMQAALCQGLFADRFERAAGERDWARLAVFADYFEPASVARRIVAELRRRGAAVRMRRAARG